ncbi:MAG: hypothetical protein H0X36_03030 [Sphingomonadaceae bacterium]|nr:hypothetical protein [Sphingomonadaceae bacterium]
MRFALKPGEAVRLTLALAKAVKLALKPAREPKAGSFEGLAAIDVSRAGKLSVALSSATYVDLIRDGKALKSAGHERLADCTGIHKTVTFDVTPGRYIIQLIGAPERTVEMMTAG